MYHRVCCHPAYINQTKDYISPIQKAVDDGLSGLDIREPVKKVKWKELQKQIKQAERNETMETNRIHTVESDSQMYSDPNYVKLTKKYYDLKKELEIGKPPAPAVVLDVFSGIGSAILILKKLKISMSKVSRFYIILFIFSPFVLSSLFLNKEKPSYCYYFSK